MGESDDVDWARAQLRKRLWEFIRADQGRTVHDAFLLFDRKREGLISRTGFKNGLACDSVALVLTDPCRKRLRQALDRQAGKTICFEDFDFFMQDDWESEEDAKRHDTSVGSSMSSGLLPLQNIEDKPKLARDGALSSGLVPIENDPAEEEKEKKRKKAEKAEKKAKKAKREKEKRVLLEKEAEEKRLQEEQKRAESQARREEATKARKLAYEKEQEANRASKTALSPLKILSPIRSPAISVRRDHGDSADYSHDYSQNSFEDDDPASVVVDPGDDEILSVCEEESIAEEELGEDDFNDDYGNYNDDFE